MNLHLVEAEVARWFTPRPSLSASIWASKHVVLSAVEERGQGPLSWRGREYAVEIVDCISTPFISDVACCLGSQIGKTVMLMAMAGYCVACDPSGILWVLPTADVARDFSKSRWVSLITGSPPLAEFVPRGKARHDFAAMRQTLGGSTINFAGSNSPSQLAGRPKRRVFLDEMEKFPPESRGGEAGAINLALQRTKDAALPFRFRCSSPALSDGPGWNEFTKGDQRRYTVPCPGCSKAIILAWGKSGHLVKTGIEAYTVWDKECLRDDGSYDFDRIHRSTRCECPHCGFHVQEHHKTAMIRAGSWIATTRSASSFRSYHLPSLYSCSPSTTLGAMAAEFLVAQSTLEGLRGFINGNLAEPWDSEGARAERTEIILASQPADSGEKWDRIMTVDVQRKSPEFWIVVRDWQIGGTGNSRLVAAETCNGVENLRSRQRYHGVRDMRLGIDVKDGVRREEILSWIVGSGEITNRPGAAPIHCGWVPMEGYEREKRWKDKAGHARIYGYEPYPIAHGNFELHKIEFSGDMLLDILALLRLGPAKALGIRWEVLASLANETYWSHLDAKIRREKRDPQTGRKIEEWVMRRSKVIQADHWLDCEVMQVAFALAARLLPWASAPVRKEALV